MLHRQADTAPRPCNLLFPAQNDLPPDHTVTVRLHRIRRVSANLYGVQAGRWLSNRLEDESDGISVQCSSRSDVAREFG